ncbi:hypothetical protein [Clostridioides difficile]|nr:hypothetical protein [Clostridioides difficile]
MDTVKRLGKGAAEAVMVSKFGLEKWNVVKEELDVKKDEKSPLRDH